MQNWIASGSVVVAFVAVLLSPWLTARQAHKHWLRELRMEVYSALLRDVYAVMRHISRRSGHPEAIAIARVVGEEEAPELTEIMGRMHVVASPEVRNLMAKFYGMAVEVGTPAGLPPADSLRLGDQLVKALDAQIRKETGADHIKLGPRRPRLTSLRKK